MQEEDLMKTLPLVLLILVTGLIWALLLTPNWGYQSGQESATSATLEKLQKIRRARQGSQTGSARGCGTFLAEPVANAQWREPGTIELSSQITIGCPPRAWGANPAQFPVRGFWAREFWWSGAGGHSGPQRYRYHCYRRRCRRNMENRQRRCQLERNQRLSHQSGHFLHDRRPR